MRLTEEQKDAVSCNQNLMLAACPGSGKTRVIISKLSRVIEEIRGTPRVVACITYTNAAVHEIESRLRYHVQPNDEQFYDICTIHSFCLNYVFRPFCHLIPGYKKGFKVLTPDDIEFEQHVRQICQKYRRNSPTYHDLEAFAQIRFDVDGQPTGEPIKRGKLTTDMARAYWVRIRKAGHIDFSSIIYYSYLFLLKRPEILSYVSAKCAWILVDEFQDTTDLQVEILSLIAELKRTHFLLVGDPYQSIFGFAGARPDLADEFTNRIDARTDVRLTGNFRSSPQIVNHANLLYQRDPPMEAVGHAKKYTAAPVWQNGISVFEVIKNRFLPALNSLEIPVGDAAILAPTWYSLFPLGRKLREHGVSIVGPGARPYRRSQVFAPLAEQVCGYLMERNPGAIVQIERTLFTTILNTTGRTHWRVFSYSGRVVVYRLLQEAQRMFNSCTNAVAWLEATASVFSEVLIEADLLNPLESDLFSTSVEAMKTDMRRNKVDPANLSIADLGIYASPHEALKLSSLHNAKGSEFRGVAMIDLHEGKIPYHQAKTAEEIEEAKRLFYVGVTRAAQFLLYITDSSRDSGQPTRFLQKQTGVGMC